MQHDFSYDLEAHKSKYEVILSFKEDIGDTLLELGNKRNQEDDAVVLMRAAEIIQNANGIQI